MIFPEDEKRYCEAFHVRKLEKCCGTCKHFERQYEDSGCANPRQHEFDTFELDDKSRNPNYMPASYGVYGGASVDEGYICDLWEAAPSESGVAHG